MTDKHYRPMWIQHKHGGMTRYTREVPGNPPMERRYSLRQVMDVAPPGKAARRRWALYAGNQRIWEVQTTGSANDAIKAAEEWISGA